MNRWYIMSHNLSPLFSYKEQGNYCIVHMSNLQCLQLHIGGRRGHDRMVVGFTTTCAISTYHH